MSNLIAMPERETPRGRVAAEVRAEMARARLSGNQLGRLTGKSQAYWWRRLSGEVAFDVDDLTSIADLMGVDVREFFVSVARNQGPRPTGGAAAVGLDQPTSDYKFDDLTRDDAPEPVAVVIPFPARDDAHGAEVAQA